jgi:hypothetical protein
MTGLSLPQSLLLLLGSTWGIAWVIADSKLSLPVRRQLAEIRGENSLLVQLLECPACMSFWLGTASARFVANLPLFPAILFGFVACGLSFVLAALTGVGQASPGEHQ